MQNEALARIKINQLLVEAGWRFFVDAEGKTNILLENHVKNTQKVIDAWGNDYEKTTTHGALDFLLVDSNHKPICVFEAKNENLHPLVANEQARKYARTVGAQHVFYPMESFTIFGSIPKFKSKDELLEEEFDKYISFDPPDDENVKLRALKYFFKAHTVDQDIREIISPKGFHALQTHPTLTIAQFRAVAAKYCEVIPAHIKDSVNLDRLAA